MTETPDRLKLLADATRWRILSFLARPIQSSCSHDDGVCGCDFETHLGVSQPTVSHHMKLLVDAGFVTAERRGRWVYYELVPAVFRDLSEALADVADAAEQALSLQAREPTTIERTTSERTTSERTALDRRALEHEAPA